MTAATRLEVWGDPIAHSRSPQLHAAAYHVLGLDWEYGRRRVSAPDFTATLARLGDDYRGLSVTYPLKDEAYRAALHRDDRADLTGAVNTLVLESGGPLGFNTDVGGIVAALIESGLSGASCARILGAGATATSALVALSELGVTEVHIAARRPDATAPLRLLGERMGVTVMTDGFDDPASVPVDLTIATLPGEATVSDRTADLFARTGGDLFDVVYGRGTTTLAAAWHRAGGRTHSGEAMLLHQAVLQVRAFVNGDVQTPLEQEQTVVGAMRNALVGD